MTPRRRIAASTSTRCEREGLLRFITCGSVDDGKCTLIGRLLYESRADLRGPARGARGRLAAHRARRAASSTSRCCSTGSRPSASRASRSTSPTATSRPTRRKFIVADTPGHEQYTRNMVTGASTADCAVILVDARKGVLTQTRRHTLPRLAARHPPRRARGQQDGPRRLLARRASARSRPSTAAFAARHRPRTTSRCIPVSALAGDNVVARERRRRPGTTGPTLLEYLETRRGRPGAHAARAVPAAGAVGEPARPRLPRLRRHDRGRRRCGRATASCVLPVAARETPVERDRHLRRRPRRGGRRRRRSRSRSPTRSTSAAATCSRAADDAAATSPTSSRRRSSGWATSRCCRGRNYLMRIGTAARHRDDRAAQVQAQRRLARARRGDASSSSTRSACCDARARPADRVRPLRREPRDRRLHPHRPDHQRHGRRRAAPLRAAPRRTTSTGRRSTSTRPRARPPRASSRASSGSPACPARASRRSPTSSRRELHALGCHTYLLDGDNVRHGLNKDLGFTDADRVENIRRVAEVARLMVDAGLIVHRLVHLAVPQRAPDGARARSARASSSRSSSTRRSTSPRSATRRASTRRRGAASSQNFTGIDSPYEPPEAPEVHLQTTTEPAEDSAQRVFAALRERGLLS